MKDIQEEIDFVITWVDGNDSKWFLEKQKYEREYGLKNSANRYREWDNLKYLFRGIEKYAPWVRRVHFITCGHLPEWLNTKNEKLNIVRHDSYIPQEYLPTFSSHPIELNIHRIEGLAEKFVYFNDDTFLIRPVKKEVFFKKGLPRAAMGFDIINPAYDKTYYNILRNNMTPINENFNGKKVIKENFGKIFSLKYDATYIKSLLLLPWCQSTMSGFINPHLPNAYLKSTLCEVWDKNKEILEKTCSHKFRSSDDVSQDLFRYWQYVTGKFEPINMKEQGQFFYLDKQYGQYSDFIRKQKANMICLNDDLETQDEERYIKLRDGVISDFESILPEKSSYEL